MSTYNCVILLFDIIKTNRGTDMANPNFKKFNLV